MIQGLRGKRHLGSAKTYEHVYLREVSVMRCLCKKVLLYDIIVRKNLNPGTKGDGMLRSRFLAISLEIKS